MGSNVCKNVDSRLNEINSSQYFREKMNRKKSKSKRELPPIFKKSNKVSSLKNSKLDHQKSDVLEYSKKNKQKFKEELNCSICSTDEFKKPHKRLDDIEENETPVAWMEECCSKSSDKEEESIKQTLSSVNNGKNDHKRNDSCLKTLNASKEKLIRSKSDGCAPDDQIKLYDTTDRFENEFESERFTLKNRSITPYAKMRKNVSLETHASIDSESLPDCGFDGSELDYKLDTYFRYIMNERENPEFGNYVKNFSANLKLSYSRKYREKCGLCAYVANGGQGQWNELDNDVTKLMDTVDKLSSLLAEKELSLNQDTANNKDQNEKKLKQKVIQLRNKKRIGISLEKTSQGKKMMVFKDGKNTYQIEGESQSIF
jgi:hypothetical protein